MQTERSDEGAYPLRDLEPGDFKPVELWLRALGGPQADMLLDWLVRITNPSESCEVLYLDGEGRSGKTLFADALSRLWTEDGPTPLSEFSDDSLSGCPLLLADEALQDPRQLIQLANGPLRVVCTANNSDARELTADGRILFLHASHEARKILEDLGHAEVRRFVTDDLLARYALWLRDSSRKG